MAKSTAPILIIGGVTLANRWLELIEYNGKTVGTDAFFNAEVWRPLVATGLAAGAFALLEKVNQPLTVGVAWVALVTTLLVPIPSGTGFKMNIFQRIDDVQKDPTKYLED